MPRTDRHTPTPRDSVRCLFTKPVEFDSLPGTSGSILTPEDRAHFLRKMRHLTPSPVHRRMNALLPLDDAWAAERVADVLFIDAETVREHRRLYQLAGVAGVEQLKFEGSDPALSPEQLKTLEAELDAARYASAKEICAFVQRSFAVSYTPYAIQGLSPPRHT